MQRYSGVVERGEGIGRALGYPTANILLVDNSVSGIYAARATVGGNEYAAAVYANQARKLLEVHLLDYEGELYGKEIAVELMKKIREDARFDDEERLRAAIGEDVKAVRTYFKKAEDV